MRMKNGLEPFREPVYGYRQMFDLPRRCMDRPVIWIATYMQDYGQRNRKQP